MRVLPNEALISVNLTTQTSVEVFREERLLGTTQLLLLSVVEGRS